MTSTQPRIVIAEGCEPAPLAWLKERAQVAQLAADHPNFAEQLLLADGLMVRTYTQVNGNLLKRAPKLRVVGRGGVGLENIDVQVCRGGGVEVVYTPNANTDAVADFVFGYMLQLLRPWALFSHSVYAPAEFKRLRNQLRGRQLNELTLGILGMGRVGRRVGNIAARGFGMRVIYHDLAEVSGHIPYPAEAVDFGALLEQCDVLSIHVDMRPGNQNLVGEAQLARLKTDAIVINTSRGEVLDAAALAGALRQKRLSGAALDVYHPEPPGGDFPLLGLENVLLTPHLAARTQTALDNMCWVVRDMLGVLAGQAPQYPAPR